MKYIAFILICLGSWFSYKPDNAGFVINSNEGQNNVKWCWAGATKILFEHYNKNTIRQSDIVNNVLGRTDCECYNYCQPSDDGCLLNENNPCNKTLPIHLRPQWLRYINQVSEVNYEEISFNIERIKSAIKTKKPVIASFSLSETLFHDMVINGYYVYTQKFTIRGWKDKTIILSVINPGSSKCFNCKMLMFYDVESGLIIPQTEGQPNRYQTKNIKILVPTL